MQLNAETYTLICLKFRLSRLFSKALTVTKYCSFHLSLEITATFISQSIKRWGIHIGCPIQIFLQNLPASLYLSLHWLFKSSYTKRAAFVQNIWAKISKDIAHWQYFFRKHNAKFAGYIFFSLHHPIPRFRVRIFQFAAQILICNCNPVFRGNPTVAWNAWNDIKLKWYVSFGRIFSIVL